MKNSRLLRTALASLGIVALPFGLCAYVIDDPWPVSSDVVVQLSLGSSFISLQDGFASWNASAADALNIWSGYLDFIALSSTPAANASPSSGDGINSALFSNTVFGDDFGEDTLAATVVLSAPGPMIDQITEADVIVNTAYQYDSYRGPQQPGKYDFHRIMLHEFGHLLGLDHMTFNPPGQAIMEPVISNFDHLGADDVAGVRHLYGGEISFLPESVTLRVSDSYSSDTYRTNNNPTSYSASGLPPGLKIDSVTGQISGTATASGTFGGVITAHGPVADAYGVIPFTVLSLDEVPGLVAILHVTETPVLADPIRPRIYAAGQDGIVMIDTGTFEVTSLVSGNQASSFRLSISADDSALLYTNLGEQVMPTEHRIDLGTLTELDPLLIPGNRSAVLEGLNHQAYVVSQSGIVQFDASTGDSQQSFASGDPSLTAVALSPDRTTLFVAHEFGDGLSAYNISGPVPVLLKQLAGSYTHPVASADGQFVYAVSDVFDGQELVQVHLPDLTPALSFGPDFFYEGLAVGRDGSIFGSHSPSDFSTANLSIYDPLTLQLKGEVHPDDLQTDIYGLLAGQGVADHEGKYFFFNVAGYSTETWVLSTDFASFPPPVHPTKNLLNISTRVRVEAGEDAMIGGFIIRGPEAKKVLIRGLGPSLPITGALSNPVLELHDSTGKLIASNDNWISNRLNILATSIAPSSERESAILMTLDPGDYTAVVHDATNQPGLSLVEVYDLDAKDSAVANISTRGKVETGDNVMIGGFIIGGEDPTQVLVRAIGPSLSGQGINFPLSDPVLEIHDSSGQLISTNDNWRSTQQNEIIATGIPPTNDKESAILVTLDPGSYTAIVHGQGSTTGVALVEVYNLDTNASE